MYFPFCSDMLIDPWTQAEGTEPAHSFFPTEKLSVKLQSVGVYVHPMIPQSVYFQPFLTCWHREVMQEHMNTWGRWISTELRSQISPEHLETHADRWFYSTRFSFPIKLSNVLLNFSQMNHCHHHQHYLCSISCYPRYYQLFFSSAK